MIDKDNILWVSYCDAPTVVSTFWENHLKKWEDFLKEHFYKPEESPSKDGLVYVGGYTSDNQRKMESIQYRSMITLDFDYVPAEVDVIKLCSENLNCAYVAHSTYSATKEVPKRRVVVPLSQGISPENYADCVAFIARKIVGDIDPELKMLDHHSFLVNQSMYFPRIPMDKIDSYRYKIGAGDPLDANLLQQQAHQAKNIEISVPSNSDGHAETNNIKNPEFLVKEEGMQEDPLQKRGIIGAFCRTYYPIQKALIKYLSDIYEPQGDPETATRWKPIGSHHRAGVTVYDERFVYSYHANDENHGKLMNAWDLVLNAKFGRCSPENAPVKMKDLALKDADVREHIEKEEPGSWKDLLVSNKNGMADIQRNVELILTHDPHFGGPESFKKNELKTRVEITNIPWTQSEIWTDWEEAEAISYIEYEYGKVSQRHIEGAVKNVARQNAYNPIATYLDSVRGTWDEQERVSTLFHDYLGAEKDDYNAAVAMVQLLACAYRAYHPGYKIDTMAVLNGPQGIGKSKLIQQLSRGTACESLTVADVKGKEATEKVVSSWMAEIAELDKIPTALISSFKRFVSQEKDTFRPAYGHNVEVVPRHCVLWGTTNSPEGYLTDATGNRRFLDVKCHGGGKKSAYHMTENEVNQIWAEVMAHYDKGEKPIMPEYLAETVLNHQREALLRDPLQGMVEIELNSTIPDGWEGMSREARRDWLCMDPVQRARINPASHQRQFICVQEVFYEIMKHPLQTRMKSDDVNHINNIMTRLGWITSGSEEKQCGPYGKTNYWTRPKENDDLEFEQLEFKTA